MTPEEILTAGLAVIESDGWHKGGYHEPPGLPLEATSDDRRYWNWQARHNGPVCSIGGVYRAVSGDALGSYRIDEDAAVSEALQRLAVAYGGRPGDDTIDAIANANDDDDTTKEDVVLAFKRAIHGG